MNKPQLMPATFSGLIDDLFSPKATRFFRDDFIQDEWLQHARQVPVNVKERNNAYRIEVIAPGIAKEDFNIQLNDKVLTISFEQKEEVKEEGTKWLRKEFKTRSFKRSFTLSDSVDGEKISAAYENGILRLEVPKKESVIATNKTIAVL